MDYIGKHRGGEHRTGAFRVIVESNSADGKAHVVRLPRVIVGIDHSR